MSDNSAIGLEGMTWTNPLNNKFFAMKEGENTMTVPGEEDDSEVVSDDVFVVAMTVVDEDDEGEGTKNDLGNRLVSIEQDVSDTEEGE